MKSTLKETLAYERTIYCNYMFRSKWRYFISYIKREPARIIWQWQKYSRKADFYHEKKGIINGLFYLYYVRKKNSLGEKLSLEIGTRNIDKGLLIYHYGNVINDYAIIGKNLKLHGNNCIGNSIEKKDCPQIGDNVELGVGAKIFGNIYIANNVTIAAGAVVNRSCYEEGVILAGVPAKIMKKKQ